MIGPTKVMSYTYLNPALVLVIGVALGEQVPPIIIFPGLLLTVVATIILRWSRPATISMPAVKYESQT